MPVLQAHVTISFERFLFQERAWYATDQENLSGYFPRPFEESGHSQIAYCCSGVSNGVLVLFSTPIFSTLDKHGNIILGSNSMIGVNALSKSSFRRMRKGSADSMATEKVSSCSMLIRISLPVSD